MRKPTQMEAFDMLYMIVKGDGREESLLGKDAEMVREAYAKTLIGDEYPGICFEFPLLGKCGLDFLAIYGEMEKDLVFEEGCGYGYQDMFRWFSRLPHGNPCSIGLELDISSDNSDKAGVYLQHRGKHELVEPFLATIHEEERLASCQAIMQKMPEGMDVAYLGLFPGRQGTPLRIGGYMDWTLFKEIAMDPDVLGKKFQQIGFEAYDASMLKTCSSYMKHVPGIDFQFDIMPDGKLGDTFGLSLSFNKVSPRRSRECMEAGYGAALMQALVQDGLADDRYHKVADATFAKAVPFAKEDGSFGLFALAVRMNYAKVKFKNAKAQPAKFYLTMHAKELTDR